ncbi:MAG TPA: penicillin-binding protein 1C [Anaerolineales bacterium]|nr:penicillin-binding protein 1C [Anaerolineales bacterium]
MVLILLLLAGGGAGVFLRLTYDLPDVGVLENHRQTPSIRVTDRYGRLLYEALPEVGGRHQPVTLADLPTELIEATIATEDSRFYQNPGVDPAAIARAVWMHFSAGAPLTGGSTLTQQLARNLLLDADERVERSLHRKLREMYLAWQLTRRYTKDEILALYLNQTYYGGLAYGVEAAAQTMFAKPAAELDLAEAALLAGLPQAPARYNPLVDPQAARDRQAIVLQRMEAEGYITAAERALAQREPLNLSPAPYPMQAPHFALMVLNEIDRLGIKADEYGGLTVQTSLDLDWQRQAERAIQRHLETLSRSEDALGHNVHNAALVALDPSSGEILALVGNPDYNDAANNGAVNMALAPRQPGSALKPLVYAAAFDPQRPAPWTAATMILDVRTVFRTHDGLLYTPENYDRREHGPVLAREALASSLNIPAVATLDHVGLEALFQLANTLGLSTLGDPHEYDLSLALGGGAVRLLELTGAYGAFANGGFGVHPVSILQVRAGDGTVLVEAGPPPRQRALDERVAWLISDILSDNAARRIGFGAHSLLNLDRPAAVKTGTTTNFHDNWAVGYTPDVVVGVWVGNADYRPMRAVDGLSGAAPIWHQFMRAVLTGQPEQSFARPDGLVQVEVCRLSGLLPSPACPYRQPEWFIAGTEPREIDHFYVQVDRNQAGGGPADAQSILALDLPLEAQPWARGAGLTLLADLATLPRPSEQPSAAPSAALRVLTPPNGSVFRLAQGFDTQAQRIRLEAAG